MKDTEELLLSSESLDDLIKKKIEEEFKKNDKKDKPQTRTITDLKKVPKEHIFTKNSVFRVFNRQNKTETFIDGMQADAMIGTQTGIREKFFDGTLTTFATENAYIKFEKAVVADV